MINYIIRSTTEICKVVFPELNISFVRQTANKERFQPKFDVYVNEKQTGLIFETANINRALELAHDAPVQIVRSLIAEISNYANANPS
jgi:hypothetical protein